MKWIKRMAGMIAGISAFAIAVCILNYMYVAENEWGRILWHSFYEDQGEIDNLYLGSSHVYCDIDPYKLDQLNGQYNFNLASAGQMMNATYYLLREADRQNRFSHVYVELYYWVNVKDNFNNDAELIKTDIYRGWQNSDYMRFSLNKLQYMITMSDMDKYPETFFRFSRYRVHLADWDYVEEIIQRKKSDEYLNYQNHKDWEDVNGYEECLPKGWQYSSREYPDKQRLFLQDRILGEKPMAETSEAYLRKVISYCQAREIPITFFISPTYELQMISTEHYDNYLNQVKEIASEYGVDIYDFNLAKEECLPIQKTRYFRDVGHLNSTGADLYTEFFHKIMSGDASENQKFFYNSYEEKLTHAVPEVYGVYYRNENGEDGFLYKNMVIASNKDEGMEYRIVMTAEGDEEPHLIQDFSENKTFRVDSDEHGTCTIIYRMKGEPDAVQTIEITY